MVPENLNLFPFYHSANCDWCKTMHHFVKSVESFQKWWEFMNSNKDYHYFCRGNLLSFVFEEWKLIFPVLLNIKKRVQNFPFPELYSSHTSISFPSSNNSTSEMENNEVEVEGHIKKERKDKTKFKTCSYKCQFCEKSFPRLGYLKKHEQVSELLKMS